MEFLYMFLYIAIKFGSGNKQIMYFHIAYLIGLGVTDDDETVCTSVVNYTAYKLTHCGLVTIYGAILMFCHPAIPKIISIWLRARCDASLVWWRPENYVIVVSDFTLLSIFYTVIWWIKNHIPTQLYQYEQTALILNQTRKSSIQKQSN